MKRLILSFLLSAAAVTSAYAADLGAGGYKDDALANVVGPCAGVTWNGLRVGGLVGVGMTGIGAGEGSSPDETVVTGPLAGSYQLSTVGQLEVGGDYQFRNSQLVLGVFGNLGFGSGKTELTYSANLRAGVAVGSALFYGFGGYEKAHLTDLTGVTVASLKSDPSGFVYGAGVDVSLGHGWYAGVRAERADYGTLTATGTTSVGGFAYADKTSATDDRGLVTVGYHW